jgi:YD repeat-containing protein
VAAGCLAAGRFLVTWDWGANGCKTLTTHFAIDGSRVKDARGVSATRENCDDWGNPTRIEYLDENDRLTTATDVGARWEGTRDAQGRLVATAWYGVDGRPIVRAGRVFDRYQYDAAGRTIEATRHAADGTLVASEGAARIVFIYDDDGHLVERRYLGVDGKLARYRRAQAIERHRYDSRGNDVLSRAFGPDGLLTRSERGYASREVDYDAFDQPIDERTFGVDGKPVDSGRGYARRKLSYDPAGRAVTRELFDAEGNPVPRVSLRHVAVQFATSDPPTVARTKAEARARADEILARLGKGEPWASVVERFSDDRAAVAREGWLGDFGPSAKDWSELVEAAKGLKKGDVGGVVERFSDDRAAVAREGWLGDFGPSAKDWSELVEAAKGLKKGDVSGVVERWDSFHIVMLED